MQERHTTTVERQLAGSWKLVSFRREVMPSRKPAPERARSGYLTFAPGRRMMTIVVPLDRKRPTDNFPTDQETIALFAGLVAYAGTYAVEGDKLAIDVDTSWNQTWTGTRQIRSFHIDGRRLTLTTPPRRVTADGQDCVDTEVWEKVG